MSSVVLSQHSTIHSFGDRFVRRRLSQSDRRNLSLNWRKAGTRQATPPPEMLPGRVEESKPQTDAGSRGASMHHPATVAELTRCESS
ncbi:unnamed protein product [Boreogadus saida]